MEGPDEDVQSLAYLHGTDIFDYLLDRHNWDAEHPEDEAPDPDHLAGGILDWLYNHGYDPDQLVVQGEPPLQVPGLDITPALREAVLGGQPMFQGVQGATEFALDGKAIIRGFASANISTALHELFHVARRQRLNRNVPVERRGGITDADLDVFEQWAGATNGWTVEAEEKAARGFERYLRDGGLSFKNPVVQKVFEAIKQWMLNIYVQLEGSAIDIDITPEVRAIFDKMLGAEIRAGLREATVYAPARGAAVGFEEGDRVVIEGGGVATIVHVDGDQLIITKNDGSTDLIPATLVQGRLGGGAQPLPQPPKKTGPGRLAAIGAAIRQQREGPRRGPPSRSPRCNTWTP